MLERAKEVTRSGKYTYVEYARFADDLVVLIDAYQRHDWLMGAVTERLREEFAKLQVEINDEKSRTVNLERGESFGFLGFDFRYLRSLRGAMRPHYTPKLKKRTARSVTIDRRSFIRAAVSAFAFAPRHLYRKACTNSSFGGSPADAASAAIR